MKLLPTLAEAPIARGTRVLVRLPLNVPLNNAGMVTDDFRLRAMLPTLHDLVARGAKVIGLSHLGKDGSQSLAPVVRHMEQYMKMGFLPDNDRSLTKEIIAMAEPGSVFILENLRRFEGEEANEAEFAKELAELGEIFVNEDFAASHREHASIVGLPKLLPSFVGLEFEQEYEHLTRALAPEHPAVVIIGGIKLETKEPMIKAFLPKADQIFLGSYFDTVKERVIKDAKVILPSDVTLVDGSAIDVGPNSLAAMITAVQGAKFVIWNGPLGKFEEGYSHTTKALAEAIGISEATSIVGGGDSVSAIQELNMLDKFTFVSIGGGAMLDFLAHGTLPGIEAILKS